MATQEPSTLGTIQLDAWNVSHFTRASSSCQCLQEVNSELKELQRENPDMWAPESLYYAGIVRRAVNPYHVVELEGWLKVRACVPEPR